MSAYASGARGRWLLAAVGAAAATAAVALLFRLPSPPVDGPAISTPGPGGTMVRMAKPDDSDLLLKQETELRDLRPLFLPTERNAALPDPRLEPGRTFLDNETVKLTFAEAEVQVSRDLPPIITLNGKPVDKASPVDALDPGAEGIAILGIGRRELELGPIPSRGGFLVVTAHHNGKRVLEVEIPASHRPPGDRSWAPLQMIAVVDAVGLVSPLVVTEGSRVEEVDAHFRNYLTRVFRIGDRLEAGFYRISVAP